MDLLRLGRVAEDAGVMGRIGEENCVTSRACTLVDIAIVDMCRWF